MCLILIARHIGLSCGAFLLDPNPSVIVIIFGENHAFLGKSRGRVLKTQHLFLYLIVYGASLISLLLFTPLLLFAVVAGFAIPVLGKLYRTCRIEEITPEWLENFSTSTYLPMEGLLANEDFTFLSGQPGFDLSLHRKLRRERLRIFRQYLTRLISDFNRLHLVARTLIAQSPHDQSELLSKLIRLKIRFSMALIQAEASYVLCRLGLGSLAVRALISQLDEMHSQLNAISAAQTA